MEVVSRKEWHYTIVENAIIDDISHFDKALDKLVYITLCRFANKITMEAHPSISTLAKRCGCSDNFIRDSLKRLRDMGLILIEERKNGSMNQSNLYTLLNIPFGTSPHEGGTSQREGGVPHPVRGGTSHGEPELKKENYIKKELQYTSDFESFWSAYPRRVAKKEAFKNWNTRLKDGVAPGTLIQAATNYAKVCQWSKTETQFIMHPSTFLGPNEKYADYIQPEKSEQPASPPRKTDDDDFLTKYGYRKG